ncbi:hypothetical protein GCM10009858_33150 [Terrabacter carboxydivorans]|uniref:Uncharacterized protein n=1 Tax=Terrabacter carboxydivorans TaxID=619730 RepID=A0ABP5ZBV2_9MICO
MQLAQGCGVEGARLHALHAETPQSRAHLTRRAGREGQGQHALRLLRTRVHGIRDPVGDGAGLARAGTREDAQGARRGRRDLALLGVEPLEDLVGRGCGGYCAQE